MSEQARVTQEPPQALTVPGSRGREAVAEARCPWSVISYGPPLPLRPLLLDLAAADAARLIDLVLDEPADLLEAVVPGQTDTRARRAKSIRRLTAFETGPLLVSPLNRAGFRPQTRLQMRWESGTLAKG